MRILAQPPLGFSRSLSVVPAKPDEAVLHQAEAEVSEGAFH